MSNTASLNIANIQVFAEAAAAADRSAGTYNQHISADPHYYIWQGQHQTIPMGMNGDPEQFVARMIQAVPGINCLRIPFNVNSFNADGSLDPQFERFLVAAARSGLQLIPVLADGPAQEFEGSSSAIATALGGPIFDQVRAGWTMMKAWMDHHPLVESAVYGWELLNEPATYARAVASASAAARPAVERAMVELYVSHMQKLAGIVGVDNDARLLVSGWGYGGDTETLATTQIYGGTALDALRTALGDHLVWSLHYYPGWMGTANITNPAQLQAVWAEFIAPLRGDNVLMTEINAPGTTTYNPFEIDQITTATALSMEWLKDQGIGLGWFPAVQTGSSGLALIERDGDIRYLNQPSLAAALNVFSYGQAPAANRGAEVVRPTLVDAVLRNQINDPDYAAGRLDSVGFAGIGFGYAGDDTLVGAADANNFLYGGTGHDLIGGSTHDDFLFGQDGNDFIASGDGIDHIFGGKGNDTIVGNHLNNTAYGGAGADVFAVTAGSSLVVVDFSVAEHDRWVGSATGRYAGHTVLDANNDGQADLLVSFTDGAVIQFLGVGDQMTALAVLECLESYSNVADSLTAQLKRLASLQGHLADALWSASSVLNSNLLAMSKGTGLADSLIGTNGNDVIDAKDGSDIVYGGAGNDSVVGGSGQDILFGNMGTDTLLGGSGEDTLLAGSGDDYLDGGGSDDLMAGGMGADTIFGGTGNDLIKGDDQSDRLFGGAGDDTLAGGSGDDLIDGGAGNDLIDGGDGVDTVNFSGTLAVAVRLSQSQSQNTGYGSDRFIGIENVVGAAGNDTIAGNSLDNRLSGGDGSDSLSGLSGNDMLSGGAGNDVIYGDDGNDSLWGGVGNDTISGGAGSDVFVFNTTLGGSNVDKIIGFTPVFDTILLDRTAFAGLTEGALSVAAFSVNTTGFATDTSDRIIYDKQHGNLYFDSDGTGAAARVLFATLGSWLNLSADDFWIT